MAEFASYSSYQQFRKSVKDQWRYTGSPQRESFLTTLLETSASRQEVIASGSYLWRAQLGQSWYPADEEGEEQPAPHDIERMKPRRHRATEGRANPKGIPYLYVATHQDTAVAEVRPLVGSHVSVAQFVLKRDIRVVNFVTDDQRSMIYSKEPAPEERERAVWRSIDRAFSQPVTSADDTADYAPTQVIAEFFRANGLDGIAYGSSLGPGHSIALFDIDVARLVNCGLLYISRVKFDSSMAANPYSVGSE